MATGCCGQAHAGVFSGFALTSPPRDDVAYVRGLIDRIGAAVCLDLRKVYATGFSNGGFFSYRLACEAADVIAAVAPVSGGFKMDNCNPSRPIPILHFQGTADNSVNMGGWTPTANGHFPPFAHGSIQSAIDGWVTRNGCNTSPTETFRSGATVCNTYSDCDDGADVTYCSISGMGHAGLEIHPVLATQLGLLQRHSFDWFSTRAKRSQTFSSGSTCLKCLRQIVEDSDSAR